MARLRALSLSLLGDGDAEIVASYPLAALAPLFTRV
jgi:hypothetical protein